MDIIFNIYICIEIGIYECGIGLSHVGHVMTVFTCSCTAALEPGQNSCATSCLPDLGDQGLFPFEP